MFNQEILAVWGKLFGRGFESLRVHNVTLIKVQRDIRIIEERFDETYVDWDSELTLLYNMGSTGFRRATEVKALTLWYKIKRQL